MFVKKFCTRLNILIIDIYLVYIDSTIMISTFIVHTYSINLSKCPVKYENLQPKRKADERLNSHK